MRSGKSKSKSEAMIGRCETYRNKIGDGSALSGKKERTVGSEDTDQEDRAVMKAVRAIAERGGDAEIRKRNDGSFSVYEVYKSKVGGTGEEL